ncbi:MAG: DUF1194 domain-containing protein [Bauldia sp.]
MPLVCRPLGLGLVVFAAIAAGSTAEVSAEAARPDSFVDLQLVLAVDVSKSMASLGDIKQTLQRNGYVEAFLSPDVQRAITSGPYGRIAVTYIEWSSPGYQRVVVPWRVIADRGDAEVFAADLAKAPMSLDFSTSISAALLYAEGLFRKSGLESTRRAIDVSGDGTNNGGRSLPPVRDQVLRQGIVINGLPILIDTKPVYSGGTLADYYEDCVIGGPGSFLIAIGDLSQFAEATRRKLVREITSRPETASAGPARLIRVAEGGLPRQKTNCVWEEEAPLLQDDVVGNP